jgi:hypothetical protein
MKKNAEAFSSLGKLLDSVVIRMFLRNENGKLYISPGINVTVQKYEKISYVFIIKLTLQAFLSIE